MFDSYEDEFGNEVVKFDFFSKYSANLNNEKRNDVENDEDDDDDQTEMLNRSIEVLNFCE